MEKSESETSPEESSHLSRNRSFKSKQLVRSQAIRESQSPPRTVSPAAVVTNNADVARANVGATSAVGDDGRIEEVESSHVSDDRCSDNSVNHSDKKKQHVEIQITSGGWDAESQTEQRQRTKRWLGLKQHSRDLLSKEPRVACVCGACNACPYCRGRRRKHLCPTKQDSGIVCSDDCPECTDMAEQSVSNAEGLRKINSLDVDDQYCRCPERKEKPKNISLNRTDSDEKTEPTGPDLVNFIKETLNKNARDRVTLLKIEKELNLLVKDTGRCIVRFPVMTSYGRMLVHRCAALFQLSHHLDQNNKTCVLVSKSGTSGGCIPCTNFKEWCTATFPPTSPMRHQMDSTHAKSILKRDTHSLDEPGSCSLSATRSKSLEQREKEYEKVRRRIFSSDNCTQDESQCPWMMTGPIKLLTSDVAKNNKLVKVQSLESGSGQSWRARGVVSKSHSFGGYAAGEPPPRLLSRQGDLASSSWRLSPSSSGYRTLSMHSTDSVTPSPTGGASPEPTAGPEGVAVVWAVTNLSSVPSGALVIHPQTGRPITNPDGSLYHFDPANPPDLFDASTYVITDQKYDQNCEKRRGRLEKQHSFIDSEFECQPNGETRCCCEDRRHEACAQKADKVPTQPEAKMNQPTSPSKSRYEQKIETTTQNAPETTNHRQAYEAPANHKQAPEVPTNQQTYEVHNYNALSNQRAFEPPRQGYEATNQRAFEIQRPPSFDANQKYEATNQRTPIELANHKKVAGHEEVQYVQHAYQQSYRPDEITSPQTGANHAYIPQEYANMQGMVAAKMPVQLPDPHIRPVSLTNVMYPAPVPQAYPYVNQVRIDQPLQPMYQQVVSGSVEEPKQLAPSPHTENTFRIDPSYPYPPLDYTAQCGVCVGACADPSGMHQHRSFPVSYAQPEAPVMQYPLGNMILQQPPMQPYPYQEPVQWPNLQPVVQLPPAPKLYVHELYPLVQCATVCPPYGVYPQMIQQPYQLPPTFQGQDKMVERRGSLSHRGGKRNSQPGSSRNTPLQTPPDDKKVPYNDANQMDNPNRDTTTQHNREHNTNQMHQHPQINRQNSNEIAMKIQQIKDHMAQLNTRERDKDRGARGREDWKRRNSGNGILGSFPVNNYNGRLVGRPTNDESQLTSAARAIVNSIRNIQVKNNYQDQKPDYNHYRPERERPDFRNRRPDLDKHERFDKNAKPDERDGRDRRNVAVPFQYRPPYLLRQMAPGTWCRQSPGPIHPVLNHPRRPHPDNRNGRRQ